jgi:hypothetical protein
MYLWKLERPEADWGECDSAVVAAPTEDDARKLMIRNTPGNEKSGTWLDATVEHVGETGTEPGAPFIVLASVLEV